MIYLDNAATTYPKPEAVYKALDHANRELAFNAGRGSYPKASSVHKMIEETRMMVGALVGAAGSAVSFVSSATEALNLIINGLNLTEGDTVYVSPFEHNAVIRPLHNLKVKLGITVKVLPFDKETWEPDMESIQDMFALDKPAAVFISHISNVTGYIVPFENIFAESSKYNSVNILDCSQSLGVVNPDVDNTDFVVFAGHKSLYASFGVAGFINLKGKVLFVVKSGGTGSDSLNPEMPESGNLRYEAGSSNAPAIAGLHESLQWLQENPVYQHEKLVTDYLIDKLNDLYHVHAFLPEDTDRICGIVSFQVDGYSSEDVGTILSDEFGICVRTGYHCAPDVHKFIGSLDCLGTVRISIGAFTTEQDIDAVLEALESLA